MARFLAGAAACFLLLTGAFLFWQSRAEEAPSLPAAPPPRVAASGVLTPLGAPPEATPKSREEKRFSRADKDDNGRIEREELLAPRRKAFAKLDKNGNVAGSIGKASFDATQLTENARAFVDGVVRAKPASAKGNYIQSVTLAGTMLPGLPLEAATYAKATA